MFEFFNFVCSMLFLVMVVVRVCFSFIRFWLDICVLFVSFFYFFIFLGLYLRLFVVLIFYIFFDIFFIGLEYLRLIGCFFCVGVKVRFLFGVLEIDKFCKFFDVYEFGVRFLGEV